MKLKLYVWDDVFIGYYPGLAVAIAPDVRTAREMVFKTYYGKDTKLDAHHKQSDLVIHKPKVYVIHDNMKLRAFVIGGGD